METVNLQSIGAIAIFVTALVQAIAKPALATYAPDGANPRAWYGLAMNGAAVIFGVLLGLASMILLQLDATAPTVLNAVLVGVSGGLSSIGVYEGARHIQILARG